MSDHEAGEIELPDIYLKRQDGSQVLVEEMDIRPESAFIKTTTGEAIFLEGPVILTDLRMTFEGDDNSVIMGEQINTKFTRLEPFRITAAKLLARKEDHD